MVGVKVVDIGSVTVPGEVDEATLVVVEVGGSISELLVEEAAVVVG